MTIFNPDFLITPFIVKSNKKLQPNDGDVYAVVYWFEKLKDGRCTAKNETIAEILGCKPLSVANSLKRLEDCGYIERIFKDRSKRQRLEIKTLVSFQYHQSMKQVSLNDDTASGKKVSSNNEQNKNSINNNSKKRGTPFFQAGEFFEAIRNEDQRIEDFAQQASEKYALPLVQVKTEFKKFASYWTELSRNGKMQRWQDERFFEVGRRLTTWFSKIKRPKGKIII